LFLLAACALFAGRAGATAICTVSSTGAAFGAYDGSNGEKDTVGTISVTCVGSIGDKVDYSIAISAGSGSPLSRTMTSGSSHLNYNLFSDAGHTVVWGDGSSGTATVTDHYTLSSASNTKSYTVYGRIRGQNRLAVGSYMDTLVITLNY
jgi:spore coat protein U-like protein